MLPRLEAETELKEINAMAMAFGGVRPTERRRHFARLRKLASGGTKSASAKPTPAMLAAMGVAVIVQEVPANG